VRVTIISNVIERKGLWRDYRILAARLTALGHDATALDFRAEAAPDADLTIALEVHRPQLLRGRAWLIPNPEWWSEANDGTLSRYERILCKTRHAVPLFATRHHRAELLGWESEDHRVAGVAWERRFLHVAGGSIVKGTAAILDAWRLGGIRYPLTIASPLTPDPHLDRVTVVAEHQADEAHARAQTAHAWHLQPSLVEGFGHVLHEALGVGATLVTTDALPMNECHAWARVSATVGPQQRLMWRAMPDPRAIRDAALRCCEMTDAEINAEGKLARDAFEAERIDFRARLARALQE
jgi:hypothetical protein